jgi:hypothetical protein
VLRPRGTSGVLALAGVAGFGLAVAEPPASPAIRCEVAVVNPVSGYAECVKPRGVPVPQPPPRPTPTPEECLKHPDLQLNACPQQVPAKPPSPP